MSEVNPGYQLFCRELRQRSNRVLPETELTARWHRLSYTELGAYQERAARANPPTTVSLLMAHVDQPPLPDHKADASDFGLVPQRELDEAKEQVAHANWCIDNVNEDMDRLEKKHQKLEDQMKQLRKELRKERRGRQKAERRFTRLLRAVVDDRNDTDD